MPLNAASDTLRDVTIPVQRDTELDAELGLPPGARGLVVFAHGSGSGRFSPRNQYVALALRRRGLATLLLDLLTPEEEEIDQRTRQLRFDIPMLAARLAAAAKWAAQNPETKFLPLGYFGASTGAGAALMAAARLPDVTQAVVSRGGRPDLAGSLLAEVRAPTLLIVGELDAPVIDLNEEAMAAMAQAPTRLEIVPDATHLFEEPGALEQVAKLAGNWFEQHLARRAQREKGRLVQTSRPL